jgi:hypothetical protein
MRSTLGDPARLVVTLGALGAFLTASAALGAQEFLYVGNSLGGDISVIAIPSH